MIETNAKALKRLAPDLPDGLNPYHPDCPTAHTVELPEEFKPFSASANVRVFLWLAYTLPCGNLKFYAAFWMLFQAALAGRLKDVHTLVEASSGNMAYCLAKLARFFGISRMIFFVPSTISEAKLDRLLFCDIGVEIHFYNEIPGELTAIEKARKLASETLGAICLSQYHDLNNPGGHMKFTAPSIWRQIGRKVNMIAAACGTTGTTTGIQNFCGCNGMDHVLVINALVAGNGSVPGARSRNRIVGTFDWESRGRTWEIPEMSAFFASSGLKKFCPIGPTSGLALAALQLTINEMEEDGSLKFFREPDGICNAVVVCGDTSTLYPEEYRRVLGTYHG